jgi:actin-related protein
MQGSKLASMRMNRVFALIFLAAFCSLQGQEAVTPSSASTTATLSQEQIREIVRQAADKDLDNNKAQRNYTYIQRVEEHKLDGDGNAKSTETRTYEIMVLFDAPERKQIAKDDKPLPEKDAQKEDERIQKIIDKRKNESENDRKKRLEKAEKDQQESREFVKEIADAYNFRLVGSELLDGHDTYVIDADPRQGYEPHLKDAKFLPKFRFRAWVDKTEKQWIKLDVQCIDTVSVGLFLVRLHKGSNIQVEQTRVNDEVWLPKHVTLKIDARVALIKGMNMSQDVTYRDYKKFRTETKIVPIEAEK